MASTLTTATSVSRDPLRNYDEPSPQAVIPPQQYMTAVDVLRWHENARSLNPTHQWTAEDIEFLILRFKEVLAGDELGLSEHRAEIREFKGERPDSLVLSDTLLRKDMKELVQNPESGMGNMPTFLKLLLSGRGMIEAWVYVREVQPTWWQEMDGKKGRASAIRRRLERDRIPGGARRALSELYPEDFDPPRVTSCSEETES